jgi:hypothetical protein
MTRYRYPHYRRYRRYGQTVTVKRAAAGFGAALVAAGLIQGASQHPSGHHTPEASTMAITTPSGGWTSSSWAREFLREAHLRRTGCNLGAVTAWIGAEGSNPAWHNLLDTTQPEPGSQSVNSDGVRDYVSWAQGLTATVTTLYNGDYPSVVAALENGRNAQAVADAVASSPWGTESFEASC